MSGTTPGPGTAASSEPAVAPAAESGPATVTGGTPAAKPDSARRTLALLVLDIGAPTGSTTGCTVRAYPP